MSGWDQIGSAYGDAGGKLSKDFKGFKGGYENFFGTNEDTAKENQRKLDEIEKKRLGESQGVLDRMKEADTGYYDKVKTGADSYLNSSKASGNSYLGKLDGLDTQARDQATNAQTVYTNDIAPRQKSIMEDAHRNASSAMSLEEAMDPNNRVAKGVRGLYADEGEKVRKQGLMDTGVLAALGAQATASQMGGMPMMTGSNLQTMNAQNQSQASEAFAAAQKRMMDLREQGLGKGLEQSNAMYDRGQQARAWAADATNNFQNSGIRNDEHQANFRGERQGYAADRMGVERGMAGEEFDINSGLAGLSHGLGQGQMDRELGFLGDKFGSETASLQNFFNAQGNAAGIRRTAFFDQPLSFGNSIMGKGGGGGGVPTAGTQQSAGQQQPGGYAGQQGGGPGIGGNPYSLGTSYSGGGGGQAGGYSGGYTPGSYGPAAGQGQQGIMPQQGAQLGGVTGGMFQGGTYGQNKRRTA
jgi:hypothetical protein